MVWPMDEADEMGIVKQIFEENELALSPNSPFLRLKMPWLDDKFFPSITDPA
jgi:hypothetical protein